MPEAEPAGVLSAALGIVPGPDESEWTANRILRFVGQWRQLGLPELTGVDWQGKNALFQTRDIARVSQALGLSGRNDVGITLEHQGYQVRIVQADRK